ncbi:MAG: hypothetical protein LBL23_04145 [Coriobacteriales bacterium]|jgi:hypothetical protein|nr:hypothetical protein [Coriobacteriales bacterium]
MRKVAKILQGTEDSRRKPQPRQRFGVRRAAVIALAVMMVLSTVGAPLASARPVYAEAEIPPGVSADEGRDPITVAALSSFTTLGTPTLTSDDPKGLPVIGVALRALPGTWLPEPSSFSYQWFSYEEPISGATGAAYVPVIDDWCNEISVKVTAHRSGYEDATVQSGFVQPEPFEDDGGTGNGDTGKGDDGTGHTGDDDGGAGDNTGDKDDEGDEDSSDFRSTYYPWAVHAATGNYLQDNYDEVPAVHSFESVTQERLLDILSSAGDYYLVFGGPSRVSSQRILPLINQQAQSAGITRIYHFDPLIDGYQADITVPDSPYRTSQSISALWDRITALLPTGEPLASYDLTDTLFFRYHANPQNLGSRGAIPAFYRFTAAQAQAFDEASERSAIDRVFRNGSTVVLSSVRTDLQFFNRVYNASATLVNSRMPEQDYKVDAASITLFDGLTESNFKLHQISFAELQNLYNTPGEHIIFFGASWCHNTQAIIGTVAAEAARNPNISTVYVYDTTLGNQVSFGTGANNDRATAYSSVFNTRNGAKDGPAGNNNLSYVYGEAVRPLGSFLSENNTNKTGSIEFYANGDLSGTSPVSSVLPWNATGLTPAASINAIRLQLPFLVAYDKDSGSSNKAVRQWLHQQTSAANEGKYLEYMLELAWVRAGGCTSAAEAAAKGVTAAYESTRVFRNGGITNDEGLTIAQAGARAIAQVNHVLQVSGKEDTTGESDKGESGVEEPGSGSENAPAATPEATPNPGSAAAIPITFRQGAGTSSAATTRTASAALADGDTGSESSNRATGTRQASLGIPEAATPLGDVSAASSSAGTTDFRLPLAVALLLTALAVFAAIGIKTGFIARPVPKKIQEEGGA